MILSLADFDYTKYNKIKDECDVLHYITYQCFKKYIAYCEIGGYENNNNH